MLIIVIVLGLFLAVGLLIVGVSTKKVILLASGAIIGMLLIGLLLLTVLVNSSLWSM